MQKCSFVFDPETKMFFVNMQCESIHKSHCLACNDSPHTTDSFFFFKKKQSFLKLLFLVSGRHAKQEVCVKFDPSVVVGDCARLGDVSLSSSTASGHMVRSCAPREFRDNATFCKCVLDDILYRTILY